MAAMTIFFMMRLLSLYKFVTNGLRPIQEIFYGG
jgi:hypothetical protein